MVQSGKISKPLLLLFLLIALGLSACSPAFHFSLKKKEKRNLKADELNSFFDAKKGTYLFKTKIWLYDNYFTGLMVIKQNEKGNYRTVFMNEMGIKFFDFEFLENPTKKEDDFIVHYCLEAFDKKVFISNIE